MNNKKVAIIGCGWLGSKLAPMLLSEGFFVSGSTTRQERLQDLVANGVDAHVLDLKNPNESNIKQFIGDAAWVVVMVPPKNDEYPEMMTRVALACSGRKIIFTSSISVYRKNAGAVDETSKVTDSPLSRAEAAFSKGVILRLGGLMGYGRHPVRHLSGRIELPNPDAPINLVHADDANLAVLMCIRRDVAPCVINVVAPWHPGRKDYYTEQAHNLNLPLPQFAAEGSMGKTVNSACIQDKLGFRPNPDLLK